MRYLPFLLALTLLTPALLADEPSTAPATRASATQPTPEDANFDEAVEKKVLAEMIAKTIRLLEAKEYAEAIHLLMLPAMVEEIKAAGHWEDFLQRFGSAAPSLLKAVKHAQDREPTFRRDNSGISVIYSPPPAADGSEPPPSFELYRIHGKWTLK